jgi:hypothetical protein
MLEMPMPKTKPADNLIMNAPVATVMDGRDRYNKRIIHPARRAVYPKLQATLPDVS